MEKQCRQCQQLLPLASFYKHPQMKDGHLNFCKQCVKARVLTHRSANIDAERERDRQRYRRFKYRRDQLKEFCEKSFADPVKSKAYRATRNAIRAGRLVRPSACAECGKSCKPEAHHEDYAKPLEVVWLCRSCHCRLHRLRSLNRSVDPVGSVAA